MKESYKHRESTIESNLESLTVETKEERRQKKSHYRSTPRKKAQNFQHYVNIYRHIPSYISQKKNPYEIFTFNHSNTHININFSAHERKPKNGDTIRRWNSRLPAATKWHSGWYINGTCGPIRSRGRAEFGRRSWWQPFSRCPRFCLHHLQVSLTTTTMPYISFVPARPRVFSSDKLLVSF